MKLLPSLKRPTIADAWARTSKLPFGNRVFSRLIGRMAPYSGSVGATILDLSDGYCRAELRERPEIRNHLRSIHAALINLCIVWRTLTSMALAIFRANRRAEL